MDLCLAGIDCWGSFFTSFRPFEHKHLEFEPVEGGLSHDEYLRLVLSIYKRYNETAHLRDNSNYSMLERLRQVHRNWAFFTTLIWRKTSETKLQ